MTINFERDPACFSQNEDLPLEEDNQNPFSIWDNPFFSGYLSLPDEYSDNQYFPRHNFTGMNLDLTEDFDKRRKEPDFSLSHKLEDSPKIYLNHNQEDNNKEIKQNILINKETTKATLKKENNANFLGPKIENAIQNKLLGRKRKDDLGERKHTKYEENNKMIKIKTYFSKYMICNLNSTLPSRHTKFLKISPEVSTDLGIEYNITLMKKTVKNIISENDINGRYNKTEKGKNYNAILIEDIYTKNKEIDTIKILDQTYIEYLDDMRKNHLKKFKEEILKKEIKAGETEEKVEKYVDELVTLLFDFENWFNNKTPRSTRKKKKI